MLERVVSERCHDPREPWALAHGLLVAGKELKVEGGSAIDRLVGDYARRGADGLLGFPRGEKGEPIEPHPGLIGKTLLEIGVDPQRTFRLRDGSQITLENLIADQAASYSPGEGLPFHNEAWMLEVLAGAGDERVADLETRSLKVLAENQSYFEAYRDPSKPYSKPFTKKDGRPQPAAIHRYYCGGLHLFQAVQRLHGKELPPLLRTQYELLLLRLDRETGYWDRKLEQVRGRFKGAELAGHERVILAQKLKLQGHALEAYLRAVRSGAMTLEAEAAAAIEKGFLALEATVLALEKGGIYRQLDTIRATQHQLYLDLVGDSAHALHAYRLRTTK